MEDALEELSTVGGVSVIREDVSGSLYGFEYSMQFQPWDAYDLEHYLNYGDMPSVVVRQSVRQQLKLLSCCQLCLDGLLNALLEEINALKQLLST